MRRLLLSLFFISGLFVYPVIIFGSTGSSDVIILDSEEIVFDWTIDRCSMDDIPDTPARAFKDADGKVQLIASHFVNRRMIGDTIDSIRRDCKILMDSHKNPDPSKFDDREWIRSVYTTDGETIYALVHNEYHGYKAGRWYASDDFSDLSSKEPNSNQGHNNWYYQEWTGLNYIDMSFDVERDCWQGSQEWCVIGCSWIHPHGNDAARKWISPIAGTITITGNAHDNDPGGGDGVIVSILKNDEELWAKDIANGDTSGFDFNLEVSVGIGDAIYFRVNEKDNSNWDSTYFNPSISIVPCQCPSNDYFKCWYNTVAFAKSVDKGCTYSHITAPNHLVASAPYPYVPDTGPWGIFDPSNIIYNANDGYYYVMLHLEERFLQDWGTGVMRTKTLDDPNSWRAWNGEDFIVQFINPYTEPNFDPAQHVCQPVSRQQIGKLHEGLTFNTYFNKFLLVGAEGVWDSERQMYIPGFYYSLSDDLIHWTPRKLIMEARLPWTPDWPGEVLLYPSLIDPNDTSRNFEVTGQQPYLYYTRFHPYTSENLSLDRDLVRVQIKFNPCDFDGDRDVDFADLAVFAEQWLRIKLLMDIAPSCSDGIVNFLDWAVFADGWQDTTDIDDLITFVHQWLQLSAYSADIAPTPYGDGTVNMLDFAAFAENWLSGSTP